MKIQTEEGFTFSVTEVKPCFVDEARVRIIADADVDLTPILEILFLYFRNANYSSSLACVTTKKAGQTVTVFGSGRVTMTFLLSEQEARDKLVELAHIFSRAFDYLEKNEQVDSSLVREKENLSAFEIHKILPQSDCGECEESGCFAFATLLVNGERDVDDCGPLKLRENIVLRKALIKMIQPITLDDAREDRSDLAKFLGLKHT